MRPVRKLMAQLAALDTEVSASWSTCSSSQVSSLSALESARVRVGAQEEQNLHQVVELKLVASRDFAAALRSDGAAMSHLASVQPH